ncbi:sensor histidine kinase [Cohnella sp. WQ 127256]|uniref:sensor histidine kinase n=1 Tax=Cohnella sp. WQ 127256 TaxID=2938790 RepID=UPI0021194A7A|nr:sensor histidine kinase [Cohnella sp. WQ 127256]
MKSGYGLLVLRYLAALVMFVLFMPPPLAHAASNPIEIREWQIQWIPTEEVSNTAPSTTGLWLNNSAGNPLTVLPEGKRGMWVHLTIPPTSTWQRPGLLADRLYGHEVYIYQENQLIYESKRDFAFDLNKFMVQLSPSPNPTNLYIQIISISERAGLLSGIRIDDFNDISDRFVIKDLPDLFLGFSIVFLALIMFICSGYLHRRQRSSWISLCLIALSLGSLVILYSPLPYIYFEDYGVIMLLLFDMSLFLLIPSFNYYIDQMFEGQFAFFTKFRHLQAGYSAFCVIALFIYTANKQNYEVYYFFLNVIMSALILLQFLFIIILSIVVALRGNKNAVILSVGIILFILSGTFDLIFYYLSHKTYVLYLWKFGIIILIASLVIILARRISNDYTKIVTYSKELEFYNHRLQRTEKMKIISDLAASVAHEVRNPLQVTRGFLQLLATNPIENNKQYFALAINELDRASDIITDFLTFAKPEIEAVTLLDLAVEMKKIEAMMTPLVSIQGGVLLLTTQDKLFFYGNPSKLKQAFINIIKNSIEAIREDGMIKLEASSEAGEVIVRIIDNGEGMNEDEIVKLGVPFFSTKSKGTGLGLMVTFRIIEAMKGTIEFRSNKAVGTEVIIRFPQVIQDKSLPNELHI